MGGEQLLFLLFILFSVISALLERRKRKRAAAEDAGDTVPAETRGQRQEEEEEEEGGWPFPMGGDPFEPRQKRPLPEPDEAEREARGESTPASTEPGRPSWIERLERAAQEADSEAVARAREVATQAQTIQPKQRVEELVKKRLAAAEEVEVVQRVRRRRWTLTPERAKEAVVYAEILGPPKAERREESP